jgi:hypothetical protein
MYILFKLTMDLGPDEASIEKLVRVLGGLPIALDQAGSYIRVTQTSISEYLELLEENFPAVTSEQSGVSGFEYEQRPFFWTWEISFKIIKKLNSEAADLLLLCAFLNNADIPELLLKRGDMPCK